MKVFICISNLSVPIVLTQVKDCKEFLIYTDQPNIYRFFTTFLPQDKILLLRTKIKYKKLLYPVVFLIKRYRIKKLLSHVNNASIFFYFNAFGFLESWMLKKLSRRNKIYYSPDISIHSWKESNNFKTHRKRFFIRLKYSIRTNSIWTGHTFIYAVSNSFLNEIKAKTIELSADNQYINKILQEFFVLPNIEILYLTGGLIESGIVAKKEFISKTDLILQNLQNKKYKIYLKLHPRFKKLYSLENELDQIPFYIPANLLYSKVKIVIGYSSAVLFEFANQKVIAISLIDFYQGLSTERVHEYKKYLNANLNEGNKMYFPRNIDELMDYVS